MIAPQRSKSQIETSCCRIFIKYLFIFLQCVIDSTKIQAKILERIEKVSEMKEWVLPVNNSGPVLFKHLNYTRIYVDASPMSQHTVMFLSLSK